MIRIELCGVDRLRSGLLGESPKPEEDKIDCSADEELAVDEVRVLGLDLCSTGTRLEQDQKALVVYDGAHLESLWC